MANISYDGQSFLLDGRRIWIVSGEVHYARIPHQLWRSRLRAAKQAGLNTICTYVFWNRHELRPGVFDFEGDNDLRKFVQMVGEEGMYCILRPGPYICAEWDFGGLPPWLLRIADMKIRQANGPFLEACARYLGKVMEQVVDLQVTHEGKNTPIILVQAENEWICHNDEQADGYLRELVRYLRENGCDVPISMCNNLWQSLDGVIDTWNSEWNLAADLRQLHVVRPNAPRLVTEYWPGWYDHWNAPHKTTMDAQTNYHNLAQILAVGGQYNLYMFHGGTNFGFYAGRGRCEPSCHLTTSYDYAAPLTEAGGRGTLYRLVKRISTFASQFGQLFAHLDADQQHAAIAPVEADHSLSVIQQHGSQGTVIFLLKNPQDKTKQTTLLLPNGLSLPVPLGEDRVAWVVLKANLAGVAELTYTNLRPWAFVNRKLLVLFGPAGSDAMVCINKTPLHVTVPTNQQPVVEQVDQITVVILNEQQVDVAGITSEGVIVGCNGLDEQDQPIAASGWSQAVLVTHAGETKRLKIAPSKRPTAPKLQDWSAASVASMVDGTSKHYKNIQGPLSLEELKVNFGYGWYKLTLKASKEKALAPLASDRLHVFSEASPQTIIGLGPDAQFDPVKLPDGEVVVLADHLGRYNIGWHMGERKGLFGHVYAVKDIKLAKPARSTGSMPDPFTVSGYWYQLRREPMPPVDMLSWKFPSTGTPMILDLQQLPVRVMVLLNGEILGLYDPSISARYSRWLLEPNKHLKRGSNELKLALFAPYDGKLDPRKFMKLYQCKANLSDTGDWSFAPWKQPDAGEFEPLTKAGESQPCWYRATFSVGDTSMPLWLEPTGLSKGQIYINGHNAGRYFVATAKGKAVPPQSRYYLPEPWLHTDKPNELILFEEHGCSPSRCKLVYDLTGPYGSP